MRVDGRIVLFVLLLLPISSLYSDNSSTHDSESLQDMIFARDLFVNLQALEETAKRYELHRSQEYKDAVEKYRTDCIRDHLNEKTQKQMISDLNKRLFPSPACEPTPSLSHSSDVSSNVSPHAYAHPPTQRRTSADCNNSYPCVDTPYISHSGVSIVDKMGTGRQRLDAYGQHRDRVERLCEYAHSRARNLEKENKQVGFSQIQQKLPKGFKQSFKKRGLFERAFTHDVERSHYKEEFYLDLLEKCGENFTHEQLVQHQYAQMYRWSQYCYRGFRDFIESFALYKEYVFELGEHFKTCQRCAENIYACEQAAYDLITQQAAEIRKRRESAQRRAQQL